jgi:hypothetical protein
MRLLLLTLILWAANKSTSKSVALVPMLTAVLTSIFNNVEAAMLHVEVVVVSRAVDLEVRQISPRMPVVVT